MRKTVTLMTMAIVVVWLAGCSPIFINHDFDPNADFASYATFSWMEIPEVQEQNAAQDSPGVNKRIRDDIDKELTDKGLAKLDDDGDLLVIYYLDSKLISDVTNSYYGGVDMYAQSRVGGGDYIETDVSEGMLTIDLLDGKSKKLVWRGTAQNDAKTGASDEQAFKTVDKAIAKVFEKYPPQ